MTIGVAVFGVFMIYSAGYYTAVLTGSQWRYVTQQVLGLGIGVVGMILVSGIDYRLFTNRSLEKRSICIFGLSGSNYYAGCRFVCRM